MPRLVYQALLLIVPVCALALAVYFWQHDHAGSGVARRAPPTASGRPTTGRNVQFGPATVDLSQPSHAPAVLSVRLRPGLQVRYLMDMPSMPGMGASAFDAQPAGRDTYSGMVIFPMAGRTRIVIQVRSQGTWRPVRVLLYAVDGHRIAHET
jgi:hypothetical protein